MNKKLKKFLSYYRPYYKLLWADLACAVLVSATTLAIPLCIRYITKYLLEAHASSALGDIYFVGGIIVGLIAIHAACHTFIDFQGHMMGALMERDMRNELFDHCQKLSFKFYDEHRTGQLMTRITNDTYDLAELYHHGPEDIVISCLNFLGAFAILFTINPKLAFIALIFLPFMAIYGLYFSRKMQKALRTSRDKIGDINAQVEDSLAGIRVVQSFTNEEIEKKKFTELNQKFLESRKQGYKSEALFYNGIITLTYLMTAAVVLLGAVSIIHGSIDLADLLTFLLYIGIFIEPIQRLGNFVRLYQEGIAGFNRFMEILEIQPDIQDCSYVYDLSGTRGEIKFDNVSFKYKEEHDHVLKNISMTIKPGEYVALVGPSGVGKTTLCSLIPRFYEICSGEIYIDGFNNREIALKSLRRNIGIVQQDVFLFSGSAIENIRYGNPQASDEEVIEAAKKAHAHEFIQSLSNGYHTYIGQRGVKLSGGQKQRMSIARVFLKNPPILIFDEATSSLDNASEKAVQESLERLSANRTTLVIAHRLTTIRKAHRILVLTDNGIEEQGTHEELMAMDGTYTKLYQMQIRIEDQENT